MIKITVAAGKATETTTGVERGMDVAFTAIIDGVAMSGEVTLLPHEDGRPGYGAWGGSPDMWIDGRTLARLYEHEHRRAILDEIEAACAAACAASAASVPAASRAAETSHRTGITKSKAGHYAVWCKGSWRTLNQLPSKRRAQEALAAAKVAIGDKTGTAAALAFDAWIQADAWKF